MEYDVYRNAVIKGSELVLETGGKLLGKSSNRFSLLPPRWTGSTSRMYYAIVTRQTVLCTTPFSFGMKKLGKSTLWHTVCINKKAGVCSRLFVYAVFIRSAAILAYSGESSTPTLRLPKRRR